MSYKEIVKTQFDFGWQEWKTPPIYAKLALQYQKGSILDVGCGTSEVSARTLIKFWDNIIPRGIVYILSKIFPSKKFYQEIWFEVVPRRNRDVDI